MSQHLKDEESQDYEIAEVERYGATVPNICQLKMYVQFCWYFIVCSNLLKRRKLVIISIDSWILGSIPDTGWDTLGSGVNVGELFQSLFTLLLC